MKILFVAAGEQVQERWVDPLRAEGWGVVRAFGPDDASKIMILHGDSVKGLVVHESFAGFAEKSGLPFVILTEKWTNAEIMRHQNSAKSALGYLPLKSDFRPVLGMFSGKPGTSPKVSAGGDQTRSGMRLVEATGIYGKPENTGFSKSLSLKSPIRVLGGGTSAAIQRAPVEEEESRPVLEESVAPAPLQEEPVEEPAFEEPHFQEQGFESLAPSGIQATEIQATEFQSPDGFSLESLRNGEADFSQDDSAASGPGVLDFEALTRHASSGGADSSYPAATATVSSGPAPDVEMLKSYLTMREQDVAVLSGQLRSARDRALQLEGLIKAEKSRNAELQEMLTKAEQRLKNYDLEKQVELEVMQKQVEDVSQQLKDKTDKARVIETKLRLMSEEVSKVKDRVRVDIRRIRVREKELEGQLEILKKDSGALLQARDEKILELKRRVDLLEFNMELVQEQYDKERQTSDELRLKLKDAAQVMKQANGFLEQ